MFETGFAVGLDHIPSSFKVLQKLAGDNRENLAYIERSTGAQLSLSGKGSGEIDPQTKRISEKPLQVIVRHYDFKNLELAEKLVDSLIKSVQDDFKNFLQKEQDGIINVPGNDKTGDIKKPPFEENHLIHKANGNAAPKVQNFMMNNQFYPPGGNPNIDFNHFYPPPNLSNFKNNISQYSENERNIPNKNLDSFLEGRHKLQGDGHNNIQGDGRNNFPGDGRTNFLGDDRVGYQGDNRNHFNVSDKPPRPVTCEVCDINFASEELFSIHCSGALHNQKVLETKSQSFSKLYFENKNKPNGQEIHKGVSQGRDGNKTFEQNQSTDSPDKRKDQININQMNVKQQNHLQEALDPSRHSNSERQFYNNQQGRTEQQNKPDWQNDKSWPTQRDRPPIQNKPGHPSNDSPQAVHQDRSKRDQNQSNSKNSPNKLPQQLNQLNKPDHRDKEDKSDHQGRFEYQNRPDRPLNQNRQDHQNRQGHSNYSKRQDKPDEQNRRDRSDHSNNQERSHNHQERDRHSRRDISENRQKPSQSLDKKADDQRNSKKIESFSSRDIEQLKEELGKAHKQQLNSAFLQQLNMMFRQSISKKGAVVPNNNRLTQTNNFCKLCEMKIRNQKEHTWSQIHRENYLSIQLSVGLTEFHKAYGDVPLPDMDTDAGRRLAITGADFYFANGSLPNEDEHAELYKELVILTAYLSDYSCEICDCKYVKLGEYVKHISCIRHATSCVEKMKEVGFSGILRFRNVVFPVPVFLDGILEKINKDERNKIGSDAQEQNRHVKKDFHSSSTSSKDEERRHKERYRDRSLEYRRRDHKHSRSRSLDRIRDREFHHDRDNSRHRRRNSRSHSPAVSTSTPREKKRSRWGPPEEKESIPLMASVNNEDDVIEPFSNSNTEMALTNVPINNDVNLNLLNTSISDFQNNLHVSTDLMNFAPRFPRLPGIMGMDNNIAAMQGIPNLLRMQGIQNISSMSRLPRFPMNNDLPNISGLSPSPNVGGMSRMAELSGLSAVPRLPGGMDMSSLSEKFMAANPQMSAPSQETSQDQAAFSSDTINGADDPQSNKMPPGLQLPQGMQLPMPFVPIGNPQLGGQNMQNMMIRTPGGLVIPTGMLKRPFLPTAMIGPGGIMMAAPGMVMPPPMLIQHQQMMQQMQQVPPPSANGGLDFMSSEAMNISNTASNNHQPLLKLQELMGTKELSIISKALEIVSSLGLNGLMQLCKLSSQNLQGTIMQFTQQVPHVHRESVKQLLTIIASGAIDANDLQILIKNILE